MVIAINGSFGVGKSTVASLLQSRIANMRLRSRSCRLDFDALAKVGQPARQGN